MPNTAVLSDKTKGILCIISSAFFFALMGVFVRLSGDVPSMQKVFFRNLVAIFLAAGMLLRDRTPVRMDTRARAALACPSGAGHHRRDLQFLCGGPPGPRRCNHAQ